MRKEEFQMLLIVVPSLVVVLTLMRLAAGESIDWIYAGGMVIAAMVGAASGLALMRIFSRKGR